MKSNPSNTASSAIDAMVDAAKELHQPPDFVSLSEDAKPFWNAIILSKAHAEWTEVELIVAAQLAQCQCDMNKITVALNEKGVEIDVIINGHKVLDQMARRSMAFIRTLRMGGMAAGDPRNKKGKRDLERKSREIREQLEDEDLLAA